MALWKPDQTFYPSPKMAMNAPREKLGYVASFNPTAQNGKHDALCVIDLDPASKTYSQVVGRTEVTSVGDELHHFGWNACSAALCPYAPHPHVERRFPPVLGMSLLDRREALVDLRQLRVLLGLRESPVEGRAVDLALKIGRVAPS